MYLDFETDEDLEMEYFLAAELGWGSVAALRAGMSSDEFGRWGIYYARKAQRRQIGQ
jgi:hypothetical protein